MGASLQEHQRWKSPVKTSGKIKAAVIVDAPPAEELKEYVPIIPCTLLTCFMFCDFFYIVI